MTANWQQIESNCVSFEYESCRDRALLPDRSTRVLGGAPRRNQLGSNSSNAVLARLSLSLSPRLNALSEWVAIAVRLHVDSIVSCSAPALTEPLHGTANCILLSKWGTFRAIFD